MISIYHALTPLSQVQKIRGVSSYNHEIVLVGGFRYANFVFTTNDSITEDWFYHGVGRHIKVYSHRGNQVWEGIVNEVAFNIGERSIKVGPLLDVSNRIKVGWQHPNYGVPGDPLAGVYEETAWKGNAESQLRYGILDSVVSGGTGEEPEMLDLQDSLLDRRSDPPLSEALSTIQSQASISISVGCIGYSRMLEKQVYNLVWETGMTTIDLSAKINAILDANQFFVNERAIERDIQLVNVDVPPEDEKNRTAWGIIADHISKSTISESVKCGLYSDLTFGLQEISEDVVYIRKSGSSRIFDEQGSPAVNSEIVPGGFMRMNDFSMPVEYRITSVRYDLANDSVAINFRDSSLRKLLDSTMLGGI